LQGGASLGVKKRRGPLSESSNFFYVEQTVETATITKTYGRERKALLVIFQSKKKKELTERDREST